jgi:hypothetical protein
VTKVNNDKSQQQQKSTATKVNSQQQQTSTMTRVNSQRQKSIVTKVNNNKSQQTSTVTRVNSDKKVNRNYINNDKGQLATVTTIKRDNSQHWQKSTMTTINSNT